MAALVRGAGERARAEEASGGGRRLVRGVCPHDCWDTCSFVTTVEEREGTPRAVRIEGDATMPVTRGFLCVKVNRYLERVYHPERLLYPMRRVGRKGEGRFERIGWEEALETVADRLRRIIAESGPEAILPYSYAGVMGLLQEASMDRRFFHRLGASRLERTICSTAAESALQLTYGGRLGPDPEEIPAARLILLWGIDPAATNVHMLPLLDEARRRGATVVGLDPYRHDTARRADLWLQPRPGSDGALALALMHILARDGRLDRAYLERNTVGWEELEPRLERYTPAWAAPITGLEAAEIEELGRLYGSEPRSLLRAGYGLQRHGNGGQTIRNLSLLPALTGAWRYPGCGFLLSNSSAFPVDRRALQRPDLLGERRPRRINMIRLGDALLGDPEALGAPPGTPPEEVAPIRALFVYNSNPAAVAPDQEKVLRGLAREDLFLVVSELVMTETARYADILLPATSQLEQLDVHTSYWHLYVQLNEPAIPPLGEAVPNTELFRRLAAHMGFEEACFRETDEEMIRQALTPAGIPLERLRAEHSVRLDLPRPWLPYADCRGADGRGRLPTPSGLIEIASERAERAGIGRLPDWTPEAESPEGDPALARRYPLQLVSPAAKHFLNSSFANVESLRRNEVRPTVFVHPRDAEARGIRDGQLVALWNDRGRVLLWARVDGRATRPGVLVSPSLWWLRDSPGGRNVNALTSQRPADLGGGATFHGTLVEAAPADAAAPAGGS